MELVRIYQCLCDPTRLRLLNLLKEGPLCVCHLQEILGETQVKTSKQLGFMRRRGMVEAKREGFWMIYRLADPMHPLVEENLKCLQDLAGEAEIFRRDLEARRRVLQRIVDRGRECPDAVAAAAPGCCGRPDGKGTSAGGCG